MAWNDMVRTMAALSLCTACGVKSVGSLDAGDDGSDDASTSSDDGDPSASSSLSTEPGSESGGDDVPGTGTDPDPSDSSESGGECPPQASVCDPQPILEPEAAAWTMDGNQLGPIEENNAECIVDQVTDDATSLTIVLECSERELAQHTIVVPHNPATAAKLGAGTSVLLSYHVSEASWVDRWFAIRGTDQEVIIGGVDASVLLPDLGLFDPVGLVYGDVCPQECVIDPCGAKQRRSIHVEVMGPGKMGWFATVIDGTVGEAGDYVIVVGDAERFVNGSECDDVPPEWFRVIVYDGSEE